MADPESLLTSPAFVEILRALGLTDIDADAFQMLEDARKQVEIGEMSADEYDALKASVEMQLKAAALQLAAAHNVAPPAPAPAPAPVPNSNFAASAAGVRARFGSFVAGLQKGDQAVAPKGEKSLLESELYKTPVSAQLTQTSQKTFRKRYVALYHNCIVYYANKGDATPKGRVDLSPDFFIQDSDAHANGFVISDMNVTLTLAAETAELKGYWMHLVANVLRKLKEKANEDHHHHQVPVHSPDDLKGIYDAKLEEYKKSKANRRKSFFFRKKKEQEEELVKKAGEVALKQTAEELKQLEKKRQKELEELHNKLHTAEDEAQKMKGVAESERERVEKESARAEEERLKREEAERRAGMSMEEWQVEARARELELQKERDEIRELLEKSNQKRRQTMMPGVNVSNDEIERLERERKALQAKLDALSKALDLDMGSLEWDGSLEDAESKMKALVPKLCSENEKEAREAQVQFDQWDKIVRNHADYKKREEQKWIKWEEDEKEANQKALAEMKRIVPFEVTTGVDQDFLMKRGLTKEVAGRVMKTKIFLFLYTDKATIAKTHIADLSSRYVMQGLDIVEMRALYTCLPDEFALDGDGKKAVWRETFRTKLHQMTQKEKDGSLSKNEARNPAYRGPEASKPAGGGGAHGGAAPGPGAGGARPNPMAGALGALFAGRGAPPGAGGPPAGDAAPRGPTGAAAALQSALAARGPPPFAAALAARGPPADGESRGPPSFLAGIAARGAPPSVVVQSAAAAEKPPAAPQSAPRQAAGSTAGSRPAAGSTATPAATTTGSRPAAGSTAGARPASGSTAAPAAATTTSAPPKEKSKEAAKELSQRFSKKLDLGYTFNAPAQASAPAPLLSKDAQDLLEKMRQGNQGQNFEGDVKTYDFLGAEEERQKKAAWVDEGIVRVAEVIRTFGKKDPKEGGIATLKFGELYNNYGPGSDMLVGILMRGKKQKRVKYAGDMLFKDVHDNVNITLLS